MINTSAYQKKKPKHTTYIIYAIPKAIVQLEENIEGN